MRRRLATSAPGSAVHRRADRRRRDAFAAGIDGPVVIKTVRGGYDGRGVVLTDSVAEARDAVGRYLADGGTGAAGGTGVDAPGARGAGGPLALRAGRGLAGGGNRSAARICA